MSAGVANPALLVLSDIAALKTLTAEFVLRLSLDEIVERPGEESATIHAQRHVHEELEHIRLCQRALVELDCSILPPGLHVRLFEVLLRFLSLQPYRASTLLAATVLCTAIEASAIPPLAQVTPDPKMRQVLTCIGSDECEHHQVVSARWRARRDGGILTLWNYVFSTVLGSIAVLFWWPRVSPAYRAMGLSPDVFANALVARIAENFTLLRSDRARRALRSVVIRSTASGEDLYEGSERLPV